LFDRVNEGVLVLDPELRSTEWNQRFPVLFGVAPELLQPSLPLDEMLGA
jgi:PAS domain-containing protein